MAVRTLFLSLFLIIGTYGRIGVPYTSVPYGEIPSTNMPYPEVPYSEVLTTRVPASEVETLTEGSPIADSAIQVPTTVVPTNKVPTAEMPTTDVPTSDVLTPEVQTAEMPTNEVPTNEVPTTEIPTAELSTTEVPTTEPPNIKTVKGQMTKLIKDTKEVCNRIRSIDVYENIVISTLPLRKSLSYQTRFNAYTEDYNTDLRAIKDHMNFWRKGDDIVIEMRSIYELAKKFEAEFERKLEIYRERILGAPEQSKRRMAELREEIEMLKKTKGNLKSKLATVHPAVKPYIQDEIVSTQSKIDEKKNQRHNSSPLAMELQELIAFLGFVRDDAITIRDKTMTPVKRLGELYSNIQTDNSTAYQYIANITGDVTSLKSEKLDLENTVALKNTELQELETQEEDLDVQKAKLRDDLDKLNADIRNINSQFKEKKQIYEWIRIVLCHPNGTHMQSKPPASWNLTHCDYILNYTRGSYAYERQVEALQGQLNSLNTETRILLDRLEELNTQVNNISEEMRVVKDSMPAIRKGIQEIQAELRQFNMFQSDVEHLTSGIKSVLPYIIETRKGLLTVQSTFEYIIEDINKITDLVESADTEENRNEVKDSADEAIQLLQEQLVNSSLNITDVNQCSRLASRISL